MMNVWKHTRPIAREVAAIFDPFGNAVHTALSFPVLGEDVPSIAAEMTRGSVLVYNGSLWHGGGANLTGARRLGVAMNYCAGWVRQQENQQLGLPVDLVRHFSPRLQQLVGYGVYSGLIGHIDKKVPANLVLGADEDSHLLWDYATPPATCRSRWPRG